MQREEKQIGKRAWKEQISGTPARTLFLKECMHPTERRVYALSVAMRVGSGVIRAGRRSSPRPALVYRRERGTAISEKMPTHYLQAEVCLCRQKENLGDGNALGSPQPCPTYRSNSCR